MNSKHILPIKNKNCTCMNCLKEFNENELHIIKINELGYGSAFDGLNTQIILCNNCFEKSNQNYSDIWTLNVKKQWASECTYYKDVKKDFIINEEYEHESEILIYINSLPIQSQELIWNTFATGYLADYKMKPQDWIDYELNELPFEKCQEYALISPEEIKAYNEKFSTCEWVVNVEYSDGSNMSTCPYHAYGDKDQIPIKRYCPECYICENYKKRENEIKTIPYENRRNFEEEIWIEMLKGKINEKNIK